MLLPSGPIIWSETRQELCESLPYYRAYQTGTYVTGSLANPPSLAERQRCPPSSVLKDSIPQGYLLAGWPSRRDAWAHNGRVIISHGGGKSRIAEPAGPSSPKKASLQQDQSASDNVIRALLHSSRHRLPIVLIASESYALLPFRLPCSYAVLGWYVITDGWAEREAAEGDELGGFVRWKFRFEWVPIQGQPWWELQGKDEGGWDPRQRVEAFSYAQRQLIKQMRTKHRRRTSTSPSSSAPSSSRSTPAAVPTPADVDESERERLLFGPVTISARLVSQFAATPAGESPCNAAQAATCRQCRFASPIVFDAGWMCLRPDCLQFFLSTSGAHPSEEGLDFSLAFLQPQGAVLDVAFPAGEPPFSLIPRAPSSRSLDQARGLWCSKCGRLSCREVIYHPRCAHCGHRVGKGKPWPTVPAPVLERGLFDFTVKRREIVAFDPTVSGSSGIKLSVSRSEGLVMYSFAFPEGFGDCAVHVVQADVHRGADEAVADRLFREFQNHAWPAGAPDEEGHRRKRRKQHHSPRPATLEHGTSERTDRGSQELKRDVSEDRYVASFTPTNSGMDPDPSDARKQLVPFRRHALKHHAGGPGRMLTQQFTCNYGVAYKHVVSMGTEPLDATSPSVILSTLELLEQRTRAVVSHCEAFNELYPVLYLEHQKMSYHDDGEPGLGPVVSSLSLGSTCRMRFRLKANHLERFAHVLPRDRVVLDLPLRHGSVVVQQGADLQRYLEHCIDPDAFRIAITARSIHPANADDKPKRTSVSKRGKAAQSSIIESGPQQPLHPAAQDE